MLGDGTEIWVLEQAGIARADLVVAVTGDDEDNIIISQIARLKYGAPKVVARVNNPFNQPTFDLLGIDATICAAANMLRLIMHELPAHKFVPLLTLKRENIEVVELEVGETSPWPTTASTTSRCPTACCCRPSCATARRCCRLTPSRSCPKTTSSACSSPAARPS